MNDRIITVRANIAILRESGLPLQHMTYTPPELNRLTLAEFREVLRLVPGWKVSAFATRYDANQYIHGLFVCISTAWGERVEPNPMEELNGTAWDSATIAAHEAMNP